MTHLRDLKIVDGEIDTRDSLIGTAATRCVEMDQQGAIVIYEAAVAANMSSDEYISTVAAFLADEWQRRYDADLTDDDNYDFFLERELLDRFGKERKEA